MSSWIRRLAMRIFKRRQGLHLRPVAELHAEFMQQPGAEELMAEAEQELTEVGRRYDEAVERGHADPMAYAWAPSVVVPFEMLMAEVTVLRRAVCRLGAWRRARQKRQYQRLTVVDEPTDGHALTLWPHEGDYRVRGAYRVRGVGPTCFCSEAVAISCASTRCRAGVELSEAVLME